MANNRPARRPSPPERPWQIAIAVTGIVLIVLLAIGWGIMADNAKESRQEVRDTIDGMATESMKTREAIEYFSDLTQEAREDAR